MRPSWFAALLVFALLVPGLLAAMPAAHADSASVTGSIAGPTTLGAGLKASYKVNATGGPAIAANGSVVGTFSYRAYLIATNTTGALVTPPTGVLTNGTVTLILQAPNVTESATFSVLVTSQFGGKNSSTNLTLPISIQEPLRIQGTLVVASHAGVEPFSLTVTLDGAPVGAISVPTLAAGASYPISFAFVPANLGPGWHTLAINLASEHGLVAFQGGAESISSTFYVQEPAPNDTVWYIAGIAAFFGAIVIWSARVGARRRRPKA